MRIATDKVLAKSTDIFLFFHGSIFCGYSLEAPH